jgi:hypothetical protein
MRARLSGAANGDGATLLGRYALLDDKTRARKTRARKGRLFRERFIATCAEHMTDADAIADLVANPNAHFDALYLQTLLANRLGCRPPHPWFIELCLRYLVDDDTPPDSTPD